MNSKQAKSVVLIVDDDETIIEALNLLLEDEGYKVYNLASGHNIDEWFERHQADIILMDYLMPDENGAEITKRLRANSKTNKIPIIMLAATAHFEKLGYAAGINKFIVKPFEIDNLLAEMEKSIQENTSRQEV